MISETKTVSRDAFRRGTGWEVKPEGACLDDRCVPLPDHSSEEIDLEVISEALHMPLIHDEEVGLWSLGPESGGRALASAIAPDLELPDWQGNDCKLSSLRGSKVLLVAWASW